MMKQDNGASAAQTGLAGLRPEPFGLGHSATIPSAEAAALELIYLTAPMTALPPKTLPEQCEAASGGSRARVSVYDQPEAAIDVVARMSGLNQRQSREVLKALVEAGYVVAPRLPTNAMLNAYIMSYGAVSKRPSGIITGIAKARKRWAAMALEGTKVSLSTRFINLHAREPLTE